MKISIGIKFEDEEKLLFKAVPDDVVASVVKLASAKGYDVISDGIMSFARAIVSCKGRGRGEGDYS